MQANTHIVNLINPEVKQAFANLTENDESIQIIIVEPNDYEILESLPIEIDPTFHECDERHPTMIINESYIDRIEQELNAIDSLLTDIFDYDVSFAPINATDLEELSTTVNNSIIDIAHKLIGYNGAFTPPIELYLGDPDFGNEYIYTLIKYRGFALFYRENQDKLINNHNLAIISIYL